MCDNTTQSKLNPNSEINNLKDFNSKTTNSKTSAVQIRRDISVDKNKKDSVKIENPKKE